MANPIRDPLAGRRAMMEGQVKTNYLVIAAVVSAGLLVSGCDQIKKLAGGGKPSGQVVATVDGKEITSLQLRGELGGFSSRDPEIMKAAQQQALERVILRKLIVGEAKKEKLDKGSDYTLQVDRGAETLLAQLYQRKLGSKITQPTKQEGEAFIAAHPEMFSDRKVLFVDQVIAAPNKIAPDRLRPIKTLQEVRTLLDTEAVQYQQNAIALDTLSADPQLVAGINKLPPGEIFVIPQNGSLLFNQVNSVRTLPFVGEMATTYAMNVLRQQRANETVAKQVTEMRKAAESKIVYSDAYKPAAKAAKPAVKSAAPAAVPPAVTSAPAKP